MTPPKQKGLGRGLSALIGDAPTTTDGSGQHVRMMPITDLRPGQYQPRRVMDSEKIDELAASIKEQGILQPILARHLGPISGYEILAGERRWRAAQKAGLHEVPVLIRELDDRQALEVALVENLQREDLTALEEADAYKQLIDQFNYTQEELSDHLGKSRSHVTNTLRLRDLPGPIKKLLSEGAISAGHARALLSSRDPMAAVKAVMDKSLSVRQTEDLVRKEKKGPKRQIAPGQGAKDADTKALERELTQALGLKVSIDFDGEGGSMTIRYGTLEQLDDLILRLSG